MNNKKTKAGFTFIEIIIVIGVISICLPIVFSIFFINLRNQTKIYSLQKVKQNGDYALNIIETTLRNNAQKIMLNSDPTIEVCTNGTDDYSGSNFYFIDKQQDLEYFTMDPQNKAIQLVDSTLGTTSKITESTVTISNLTFSCTTSNAFLPPLISVSFTVTNQGISSEEVASLNYQTKVRLRNK